MTFLTQEIYNEKRNAIDENDLIIIKHTDPMGMPAEIVMFECDDAVYCKRTNFINKTDVKSIEIIHYRIGEIDAAKTINSIMMGYHDRKRNCNIAMSLVGKYIDAKTLAEPDNADRIKFI